MKLKALDILHLRKRSPDVVNQAFQKVPNLFSEALMLIHNPLHRFGIHKDILAGVRNHFVRDLIRCQPAFGLGPSSENALVFRWILEHFTQDDFFEFCILLIKCR